MELLLNILWLAITVGLVYAWHSRWRPEILRASREHSQRSFVGLVCVLAFLFPAISLSDDLHPAVIALQDTKSSYAVSQGHDAAGHSSRSHSVPHLFVGLIGSSLSSAVPVISDVALGSAHITHISDPLCGSISGRAPPAC